MFVIVAPFRPLNQPATQWNAAVAFAATLPPEIVGLSLIYRTLDSVSPQNDSGQSVSVTAKLLGPDLQLIISESCLILRSSMTTSPPN